MTKGKRGKRKGKNPAKKVAPAGVGAAEAFEPVNAGDEGAPARPQRRHHDEPQPGRHQVRPGHEPAGQARAAGGPRVRGRARAD